MLVSFGAGVETLGLLLDVGAALRVILLLGSEISEHFVGSGAFCTENVDEAFAQFQIVKLYTCGLIVRPVVVGGGFMDDGRGVGAMGGDAHNCQHDCQYGGQHSGGAAHGVGAFILDLVVNFQFGHGGDFPYYKLVDSDEQFLREALRLARQGSSAGEVPVGAVVVSDGEIVGRGWNSPIARHDPTAHAEILALREAGERLGNYRLEAATLYCTLEPCVMCAGALVAARVRRLVFGGRDLRFGGVRSKFQIADSELLNHRVEIVEGVLAVECVELLQQFFDERR